MNSDYLADGFRNVDSQSQPEKFKAYLKYIDEHHSFQEYKREMIKRLQIKSNSKVLDLGSGLGFDVERLSKIVAPSGEVIGVDISKTMIDDAKLRTSSNSNNIKFYVGDIHKLEFPDDSIDACRCDRTLQHIENPSSVISKVYRVLRQGGWMVSAEPDWGTYIISGNEKDITCKIAETFAQGFNNPWIGRQLYYLYKKAGFSNIELTGHVLICKSFTDADKIFDITETAKRVSTNDPSYNKKIFDWVEQIKKDEKHLPLVATVTLFMVSGQKN